jgi:hypothetical protein
MHLLVQVALAVDLGVALAAEAEDFVEASVIEEDLEETLGQASVFKVVVTDSEVKPHPMLLQAQEVAAVVIDEEEVMAGLIAIAILGGQQAVIRNR